ncbi:FecR domain-containing protein [Comamonas sp. GB3 AK4-5]|uniref:FecR family protein n=1 Tax=Comamonas sp. GB3 AK4-5 TaxID=3231487 RepID=UPI00351DCF7B
MSAPAGLEALPQAIAQQAVEWWLQLQEAPDSAAMHQQWQAWRCQNPLHEQAWQRVEAVQQRLQGVVDAPHTALAHAALAPRRGAGRRRAVQALVLLVFGGGAAWQMESHMPWRNSWRNWVADVRTPRGERRRLTLDDGTQLVLQGGSALDVVYDRSERRLLLRAGEVYVTSAPDTQQPARPLVVQTMAGEMRPLGTRFTVRTEEDGRSLVAVYEGAVQLQPRLAPGQVLPAGQQAWLDAHQVQTPEPAREDAWAWVDGMLVARGMRLDAVLQALQPASTATLVCHPAVAGLQVSGTYPLDDVPRVMLALGSLLHLEVRTLTRWWGSQELAIGPVGAL